MSNTKQQIEEMLNKVSEYNKLSGKGHGDLKDNCYICGISPSGLIEAIDRLVTEARMNELEVLPHKVFECSPLIHLGYTFDEHTERITILQSQLTKEDK